MMRSLYSAVSGLKGHQTRMDVIGNNIANVNTTGYKSSRVNFADMISQTLSGASSSSDTVGGTNPKQIGLGASVSSIDTIFTDGNVQSTGKNTDLALSGNGLFVVKNGNQQYYTRNGDFEFDANGYLVMSGNGYKVQGYDKEGSLGDIVLLSGSTVAPKATSTISYANNLDSSTATIASMSGGKASTTTLTTTYRSANQGSMTATADSPVTITLADGSTKVVTSGTYTAGVTQNSDTTDGSVVTVSTSNSPVTVKLANALNGMSTRVASTSEYSTAALSGGTSVIAGWQYGYETSTDGDSATASTTQPITITTTTNETLQVTSGTYTVGSVAAGTFNTDSATYTATTDSPLVLQCADGTTHTVTSGTFKVGDTYTTPTHTVASYATSDGTSTATTGSSVTATTDNPITLTYTDGTTESVTSGTYVVGNTYPENPTSTVTGIAKGYTVAKMSVMNVGGDGASLQVGGKAYYSTATSGDALTAGTDTPVSVTLGNGYSFENTSGTYTIGQTYTTPTITSGTSLAAGNGNTSITVVLSDGSIHTDSTTGATYTVGDTYNYTENGTTTTATIAGFYYTGTAELLTQSSKISEIDSKISEIDSTESISSIAQDEKVTSYTATSDSPVVLTMSDGSTVTETSGSYMSGSSLPLTTMVTIYDTLGNAHSVPIYFTKVSTDSVYGNKWTVSVDPNGTGKNTIAESDGSTATVTMDNEIFSFTTSGAFASGSLQSVNLTLTNGAGQSNTVSIDLSSLTQYAGTNTINGTGDGYAQGSLSSVAIDSSGVITGTYSNGIKQTEGTVAVAQFSNYSGLTKTGNSLYQDSNNSGTVNVGKVSDFGSGVTITPLALEMSNVDISDQFTDMIVTQRGFQSNSKIITVDDELLETVINMKR